MIRSIDDHITQLTTSREVVVTLLNQARHRAEEQLYSDGAQWTLRQLAIHLAIADKGHNRMVMTIAQGEELIPPDYDLERFNQRSVEKSNTLSLDDALNMMAESRQELLAWLRQINPAVLEMKGRHATLRILTISQILDVMAAHETGHARDIEAYLSS